ncbi:hypothetical protein [Intestinibacter bartlettii]|uniref:hypothetical protein n=1 Tax=Intestinibacter bartlettii TaxID=261299 RepID=UPI0034A17AE8
MKKRYEKPTMFREEFNISQSVASGCGDTSPGFYKDKCSINIDNMFPGQTLFVENDSCTVGTDMVPEDPNGICYHIPTDATRYFGS